MPITANLKKFRLPAVVLAVVLLVFGLFFTGFQLLTEPDPQSDPIIDLNKQYIDGTDKAEGNSEKTPEPPENAELLPDGTFDFFKYQYYSFPLPFVANLNDGKSTFTVEIGVATYGGTLLREETLQMLETYNPKLRSRINFILSELGPEDVNQVSKRKTLEDRILIEIRKILYGAEEPEPNPIRAAYLTKFVLS